MRVRLVAMLGLTMWAAAVPVQAQSDVQCVSPWAIPDKWIDRHDDPNDGVWTADDTFETVDAQDNPLSDPDVYVGPDDPAAFTGFAFPRDVGLPLTLKIADPQEGMKSGFFYAIDIGTAGQGGSAYRSAISKCQTVSIHWGDILQPLTGNLKGPTAQGAADLINLDPAAEWDPVAHAVVNSCAPSPECGATSPRIVTIIAFDPLWYERAWWHGGQPVLIVRNILTVFVDGISGGKVTGYITTPRWDAK
jgi:hypothetical protein